MTTTPTRLPVLFLTDQVVLPGMVVPVELDDAARAAIDAAQASGDDQLLIAPRLDERYARYGVVATIERVGRFVGGAPDRRQGRRRAGSEQARPAPGLHSGSRSIRCPTLPSPHVRGSPSATSPSSWPTLQRREAWQIIDGFNQLNDPDAIADSAGYASYLSIDQKLQLLESPDVEERLEQLISWTEGTWLTSRSPTS